MTGNVRIWDPLVRLFHWSLVASVAVAWITADEWDRPHELVGYLALGLVAVRVVWGFVGTRHARFASFVRGPATVLSYAGDVLRGRDRRYLGHNPLGALMILALVLSVVGTGVSGWLTTTDAFWGSEAMEELHEGLATLVLCLAAVHVGGVVLSGMRHGENLIHAMVTGDKRAPDPGDVV